MRSAGHQCIEENVTSTKKERRAPQNPAQNGLKDD
jgi:hypothetical protein